jgi:hypothetical protein
MMGSFSELATDKHASPQRALRPFIYRTKSRIQAEVGHLKGFLEEANTWL